MNQEKEGRRNRRWADMGFAVRFAMICLIIAAVGFWFSPSPYRMTVNSNDDITLTYLQKGDYRIYFDYENSPEDNDLVIFSDTVITQDNKAGAEILRLPMDGAEGSMEAAFHLEQDTREVHIYPEKLSEEGSCITEMTIQSVALQDRDNYFLAALCLGAAVFLAVFRRFCPEEKRREYGILFAIGAAACLPLLSPYLPGGSDLRIHLARIEGIYQGLKAGEMPVYINTVMMAGYGSLSATMYPQLFLYPFALLRALGVSLGLCYKLLLAVMNLCCAFFSFYAVRNMTKSEKTAYLACVFYTLSLYRLNDMYFRAALGETMALTFLPLVLWGAYEILWGESRKWHILALGMSGVMESHVLTVEMCIPFLVFEGICMLIRGRKEKIAARVINGVKAVCLTCLLNAFFLVPFLFFCREDLQVFHIPNDIAESGAYFSQMFALFPGATGMDQSGTAAGEMPMTVGGILLVGVILFFLSCREKGKKGVAISIGKHCVGMGAASLYMASWIFPWDALSRNAFLSGIAASLQFPWRFLGPATLFLSVASAIGIAEYTKNRQSGKWIAGMVLVGTLVSAFYFMDKLAQEAPQTADKMEIASSDDSDALYMYWDGEKYQAFNVQYYRERAVVKSYLGTEIECENYSRKGTQISVDLAAAGEILENDYIQFPLYYFPGYEIKIDGQKVETAPRNKLVACSIPEGKVHIEVEYRPPVLFNIANAVTLLTAVLAAGFALRFYE